jgi:hypothetical protein
MDTMNLPEPLRTHLEDITAGFGIPADRIAALAAGTATPADDNEAAVAQVLASGYQATGNDLPAPAREPVAA